VEKMLAVIFDDEKKAYQGSRALNELDLEGEISIHAESVISKGSDGKLSVKQAEGDFPIRTLGGSALGGLLGLLGGPMGFGIGAAAGGFAGMVTDLWAAGVDGQFLDDVAKVLKAGKYAVVADVNEEWITPVDTRMEALGGVVYRAARSAVAQDQIVREEASMRAELAALRAEHAKAQSERKKRLQSKIEAFDKKIQAASQRHQQQSEEIRREIDIKLQAVQRRAAQAKGEAKSALEARVADLRREYDSGRSQHAGH